MRRGQEGNPIGINPMSWAEKKSRRCAALSAPDMASDAPPAAADAAETSDFNPQPGEIVWAKMRGFPVSNEPPDRDAETARLRRDVARYIVVAWQGEFRGRVNVSPWTLG